MQRMPKRRRERWKEVGKWVGRREGGRDEILTFDFRQKKNGRRRKMNSSGMYSGDERRQDGVRSLPVPAFHLAIRRAAMVMVCGPFQWGVVCKYNNQISSASLCPQSETYWLTACVCVSVCVPVLVTMRFWLIMTCQREKAEADKRGRGVFLPGWRALAHHLSLSILLTGAASSSPCMTTVSPAPSFSLPSFSSDFFQFTWLPQCVIILWGKEWLQSVLVTHKRAYTGLYTDYIGAIHRLLDLAYSLPLCTWPPLIITVQCCRALMINLCSFLGLCWDVLNTVISLASVLSTLI